jgi:hypothetical protein
MKTSRHVFFLFVSDFKRIFKMLTIFIKYHKYEIFTKNLCGWLRSDTCGQTDRNYEVNHWFPYASASEYLPYFPSLYQIK